jgi:hypothetical protein
MTVKGTMLVIHLLLLMPSCLLANDLGIISTWCTAFACCNLPQKLVFRIYNKIWYCLGIPYLLSLVVMPRTVSFLSWIFPNF